MDPEPAYEPNYENSPAYVHDQINAQSKRERKGIVKYLAAIGLAILKLGKLLLIGLKGVKFLGTGLSMIIAIGAYALFFGWPFAVGFVLLLFIHEMGHAIQLKREGVNAGAPVFIPFLGAVISMKEMPRNAAQEARVGLAGPILGTIGTLPLLWYASQSTGHWHDLSLALVYIGAFLNLFNLLPVSPLDGGRAMAAISPIGWVIGMLMLVGSFFILGPNPILFLILIVGGLETIRRFRNRKDEYYNTKASTRVAVLATYISLAIFLIFLMNYSYVPANNL